jgi:hypothetical protein
MSEIATIKVLYKPGKYEMIINESDFDDKIHEKINDKLAVKSTENKKGKKTVEDDDVKALIGEE